MNRKAPKREVRVKERPKLHISKSNSLWEPRNKDLIESINVLLLKEWKSIPPQLNSEFINHILKFRKIIPRVVSIYQLYSIIDNSSFVDQQLYLLSKENKIIQIEFNYKLIIKFQDYINLIPTEFNKFKSYLVNTNNFIKITKSKLSENFNEDEIKNLLNKNFLSLIPQEIDSFKLSLPNLGFIIKLFNDSKKFILKLLMSTKWKELDDEELNKKWSTNKKLYKDFKGLSLDWIIHHLIGEGLIECFDTFDKKGIRLIG